jgi:hypothetical protein
MYAGKALWSEEQPSSFFFFFFGEVKEGQLISLIGNLDIFLYIL